MRSKICFARIYFRIHHRLVFFIFRNFHDFFISIKKVQKMNEGALLFIKSLNLETLEYFAIKFGWYYVLSKV